MSAGTVPSRTPVEAVKAWWTAMQTGDIAALSNLLAEDYLVTGGPDGRTLGRDAVLEQAAVFNATSRIDDWSISAIEVRAGADHAVCSYQWTERGTHAGTEFTLAGLATDVLRSQGTAWVHQARHVTLFAPATPHVGGARTHAGRSRATSR
jgi:ketosteroid isomerase-like protein